jgi:hypothetical protein
MKGKQISVGGVNLCHISRRDKSEMLYYFDWMVWRADKFVFAKRFEVP